MKTNTPKIRFKEFTDEWQEKKLGDISELSSSKRVYLADYVSSGIPFYRGKEISELKKNKTPDDILYISDKAYKTYKDRFGVPKKDDILITAVGTLGNVMRVRNSDPFYFKDGNLIWLRKINENSHFLEIILENGKNKVLKSSIGSSQRALTIISLNKLKFNFPVKKEQEKIAGFLTVVDEKIDKLEEKKKGFEKYKKGVMQAIFCQKIRFKKANSSNYPDWEEKKLGEIASFYKGAGISKEETDENGATECIRYGELYTTYKELIYEVKSRTNLNPAKLFIGKANDVIIPSSGETSIDIATASCILKDGVALGGDLNVIRSEANGIFLSYYLNNCKRFDIAKLAQGNSVVHLYSSQLKNLVINLPDEEEQEKIAEFLTSLDNKVELISKELEQTKLFKKSLLQKMFV